VLWLRDVQEFLNKAVHGSIITKMQPIPSILFPNAKVAAPEVPDLVTS
jgi:hypothetical protein